MKTFVAIVALLLTLNFNAFAAKEKISILELELDRATLGSAQGFFDKPVTIGSSEELAKIFKNEDVQQAILKQVDLQTRTLVYFAWNGSGQDQMTPRVEDGEDGSICTFTYKRGLTKDLRSHHHLFAIPKDAKWEVKHARS